MADPEFCKPDRDKRQAIRDVPVADKRAALEAAGWTKELVKMPLSDAKRAGVYADDNGFVMDFWSPPEGGENFGGAGANVEMAYSVLRYRQEKAEINEAMKAGTYVLNCNKCGKDMRKFDGDFCVGYYGLCNAEVDGGYSSDVLSDCVEYKFSLCENCVGELFKSFKLPVQQELYI